MPLPPYLSNEAVGRIGERWLETELERTGYVVNRVGDDRAGWDFVVESPPEAAGDAPPSAPLHRPVFPLRARIQVKTRRDRSQAGKGRSVDVRLSNLLRLAETPDPAFVVVVELDHDTPARVFVVHIDGPLVRSVLEQRWHVENRPGKTLHRSKRAVAYGADHELASLTGMGLLGSLDVPPSGPAYAREKSALLQEAGFEDGALLLDVRFSGSNGAVRLAEVEIGLAPSAPIDGLQFHPLRFGLVGEEPFSAIPAGDLSLSTLPEPSEVTVTVSAPTLGRQISLPGRLRVPHLFGPAVVEQSGHDSVPFRVETEAFELRAHGPRSIVSFWVPSAEERAPLRTFRDASGIIRLLAEAARGGHDVDLALCRRDGAVFHFRPALGPDHPVCEHVLPETFDRLDLAWGLARAFDVEQTVEVSLNELYGDSGSCVYMAALMQLPGAKALLGPEPAVTLRLRGPQAHEFARDDPDFVLGYAARLGSHRLVALLRLDGPVLQVHTAEDEAEYRIPFAWTDAFYAQAFTDGEALPSPDTLAQIAHHRVGPKTVCVIPPFGALSGCAD